MTAEFSVHGGYAGSTYPENFVFLAEVCKDAPIKDKTVAGESDGAYDLSASFYGKTEGAVFNELGLVPVKTICHYEDESHEKLDECQNGLEAFLLRAYGYRVFQIS